MVELNNKLGYFYDLQIQSWGYYYADYINIALYSNNGGKTLWQFHYNDYYRSVTL